MNLKNRVVMVTGSAGGIGRAITDTLLARGARVVATDVARPSAPRGLPARRVSALLRLKLDVTSAEEVRRATARVLRRFGRIDVLVNNAGAVTLAPLTSLTEQEWRSVFDVNAGGTFLCTREVVRHMIARGGGGRIINISSIAARLGFKFQSHYCAAKAAVLGFTRALALELAPHDITVNAICPGAVDTEMLAKALTLSSRLTGVSPEEYRRGVVSSIPLGRLQRPEDVAAMVAFLASPDADNITGEAINVDGGIIRN
jgi:NAD(P)-dependent dehydrogenase (short-subunit alcohol dehydrogenase family)